ncbi:uncharacterized protein [Physcomitrium patens]|uniref:uncharacterized protein isoform X2 n=1 Tax=Physcomitrium patens TaxID=3218 RepID=UPI003CCD9325
MVEAQRALLDELMGTARDLTAEERKGHCEMQWDDPLVCTCFLVNFCPHDLFVNTKSDLGPCPKIHDPKLKESYQQSTRHDNYVPRFEAQLFQFCEKLVQDLDRKVRRGRERLAQDANTSTMLMPISTEKSDLLVNIEESIKKLLEKIEVFGEVGQVDEAEALMKKVDMLNMEKAILTQQITNERGLILSQEKKMALCETCGSFLVANDATERTHSHMTGKQHVGYGLVRHYLLHYQREKSRDENQATMPSGEDLSPIRVGGSVDKKKKHNNNNNQDEGGKDKLSPAREKEKDRDREKGREKEKEREKDRDREKSRAKEKDKWRREWSRKHSDPLWHTTSPYRHHLNGGGDADCRKRRRTDHAGAN